MNKPLRIATIAFFGVIVSVSVVIAYLFYRSHVQIQKIEQKKEFVSLVGLSDLALSNERYIRHRSLSSVFQVYSIDGALREYSTESFVYTKGLQ